MKTAKPKKAHFLFIILLFLSLINVTPIWGRDQASAMVKNLNELLGELPHVRAEQRGESIVTTGWTRDEQERDILDKILGRYEGVLDLTRADKAEGGRMIEVDVTIVVVSETISESVGFDFLKLVNTRYDFFSATHRRSGTGFVAPSLVGDVSQGAQWGQIFAAAIDYDVNLANADEQQVQIIARPHLTTLNGQKAEFLAGGEIVFKVQGIESGDIKPFPFGIQLNVTPTILLTRSPEEETQVLLDVEASRLSVLGRLLTTDGKTGSDDLNFDKTMVKSQNLLAMDEILCVSGLYQREYRSRFTGVPVLRKIPLLKYFFSNRTEVDDVLGTIIFITPREPARVNQELQEATEKFIERRRRYIEAKQAGGKAVEEFKENYPDWYKPQPNGYATHFFLVNNSSIYRGLRGEDLRMEELRRDLLSVESAKEAVKKRR